MLTARLSIGRRLEPNGRKKPVTLEERKFAEKATRMIRVIVRTKKFLDEARNSIYSWPFWLAPDNTLKEKTAEQIADIIRSGVEDGAGSPDGKIDLVITLTDLSEKALAKTFPRDSETQTDTDFFKWCLEADNPGELAAVWMHEWTHVLGFVHRTDVGDQADVPYTIERIVRALSAPRSLAAARRHRLAAIRRDKSQREGGRRQRDRRGARVPNRSRSRRPQPRRR